MFSIKNKIIVYSLLLSTLITGCSKLVDIDPPIDTVGPEIVFKNNTNAASAVAGLYSYMIYNEQIPTYTNSYMSVAGGLMSDELMPFQGVNDLMGYQLYTNKVLLNNTVVDAGFWGPAYKLIYTANSILEGEASSAAKEFTDSARNQARAESRLVRGFNYFYLYNLYGDVPLVTSTDVVKSAMIPRTPVADVKKFTEEDLLYAYQHLSTNYSVAGGEKVRPNAYAAAALLARFYLYEKRWTEAAAMADYVINSGKFSLVSPDKTFKPNSNEAIWQLKMTTTGDQPLHESTFLSSTYDNTGLTAEIIELLMPDGDPSFVLQFMPLYTLSRQFEQSSDPNDLRIQNWTKSMTMPVAGPFTGETYLLANKHPRFDFSNANGMGSPYYMVFRLAELYLIRAEAKAQLNDLGAAVTDINAIRTRAGLEGTTASGKEQLLDAIMKERRVELFAEWGHRWFDLKRTGTASGVLSAIADKQPWSDNSLLLFIPTAELRNNPRLTQNPGYTH